MAKKKTSTCPKGQAWDPNKLKCVKINTETITNKKEGTSYFASPQGTVYGTGKNTQMSIDTTGYSSGKKEFNLTIKGPANSSTRTIKRKDVLPLLNDMKKEVKPKQKKGGIVKSTVKKATVKTKRKK
jgi:hypothetical protein